MIPAPNSPTFTVPAADAAHDEDLYRATFDEAPVGILHAALDGRLLRTNREFARMLGTTPDELLTLTLEAITLPDEFESDMDAMRRLVAGEIRTHTREKRFRRQDGSTIWTMRTVSVRHNREGRPLHFIGVIVDISERKEAEHSLHELQKRFQAILDFSPALINLKDLDGRYVLANRIFIERNTVHGVSPIGRTADEILPPDAAAVVREHEREALAAAHPVAREWNVQEREARHTYIAHKFALRDESGAPYGTGCVAIDITDRKQIEQQFLQAQKMEAFGQLAGGIAHDFNNILGVLLMHFNLMPLQAELPATTRSTLKNLEQVVSRAAGLVRQLLIFSRKHEVSKQVLDLNRTVEDVCRVLHRFVGEDIAFEFDGSSEPTWIEADASMVEQVVMNLCVNARDAMPRGGKLTVMLGREQRRAPDAATVSQTSYAVLSVADTGHGMDEATKARIFEPFFTTKAIGQGTGLGLATVHSIAKQHNGWVEVESAVNVGTTFRVYLPTTNARPPNAAADLEAVRRGHGRVLLVEDDDHVRAAAAKCLKLAGYAVVESTNAVDARANFSSDPSFDLLLSDLIMPGGITGTELAASLRERKPELRVVIMSGYNALSPTHPEPEVPRVVRLTKPFSATQLLDTVAKAMRVG